MKVAICAAVHGRIAVTRVWWQGIRRMQQQWAAWGIESQVFIAGDEQDQRELCLENGGEWVYAPNNPLGYKLNYMLLRVRDHSVDYLFHTGDDDFYSPELTAKYTTHMLNGTPYVGLHGLYFYEPMTNRLLFFKGYDQKKLTIEKLPTFPSAELPRPVEAPWRWSLRKCNKKTVYRTNPIGCGRLLRVELVDAHGWHLWDDERNSALDASMDRILGKQAALINVSPTCFAVDIKAGTNIWSLDRLALHTTKYSIVAPFEPDLPEWEDICSLNRQGSSTHA